MVASYRGVNNAAGQALGATTPANTVSITLTLPGSTVTGDRIIVCQIGSNTAGPTPANWNVIGSKDTIIGTGAVAAGGGQRYMSWYYRDYDSATWVAPAFTLTSATQNSHWIGAVSIQKGATDTWDTPTISTAGSDFGTANTAHSATTGSLTTHTNGFLIVGSANNDNVTVSSHALSQTGATLGTVSERADGGTATGNDVAGSMHTCSVTTGATAALTFTGTLSAASQGGSIVVEQTVTTVPWDGPVLESIGTQFVNSSTSTANVAVPSGLVADDIVVLLIGMSPQGTASSVPANFTQAGDSPVSGGTARYWVYWKRQTSATGSGETTGTYAFTVTGGPGYMEGVAFRVSNCITSGDPLDVTAAATGTGSSAYPNISDTTTVANTLLIWSGVNQDGGAGTPVTTLPSGFTVRLNTTAVQSVGDKPQAAAGATGTLSASAASLTGAKLVWLGALKPPAAPTADPTQFFLMMGA